VGPQVGLARQDPWPGRAGLWGAGDQPCCGVTGAGADGPGGLEWGPGLRAGCARQGHQCLQGPDILSAFVADPVRKPLKVF